MDNTQKKILLVEKDKAFQAIFKAVLANSEFSLIVCETGQQALNRINQEYIDFICSSLYLSDMDGIDLARQVRELTQYSFKPFVLMTSVDVNDVLTEAYSAGVTDIFHKNNLDELLAFIGRSLFLYTRIDGRILYVEDDKAQREYTTALLVEKGLQVDAFHSAEAAWASFIERDYDVVITDIVLESAMSGLVLANQIKRYVGSKGDTPILAITAYDDKTRRLELFHLGISDYIVKPIIEDELFIRVSSLITRKKLLAENLDKQLASLVYNSTSEAIFITDSNNKITATNPAFCQITGYSELEVFGKNPQVMAAERHDDGFFHAMWATLDSEGTWQGEVWNKRKTGEEYVEWLTINNVLNTSGDVVNRVAVFSDITEKQKADELVLQHANFDMLTHLPNRRLFQEHLEHEIKRSNRLGLAVALLFVDLDHFKNINDSLGHDVGDLLLIEVGHRIKRCVRNTDTVARIGGDEFTVILTELEDLHRAEIICNKILSALKAPFNLELNQVHISASIGITVCPNDAATVTNLLKNADQAMFSAKNQGRNQFCYFTKGMQERAVKHQKLLHDLYAAEEEGQFELYFQPIIDAKTGLIVKAEALLRWQHPTRGLVEPSEFISIAEESGLINAIGDWVFEQAISCAKKWSAMTQNIVQLSINTSPVQYQLKDNLAKWMAKLAEINLSTEHIAVEVTESIFLEQISRVTEQLVGLRNAGIELSIDDFGTGYSSLSYLQKLDIDYLKIDRSFVSHLSVDSDSYTLTEAIISMSHKLGLKVIAEGVETEQQAKLLLGMECDYLQGFYFSKAVPESEFEQLLAKGYLMAVDKLID